MKQLRLVLDRAGLCGPVALDHAGLWPMKDGLVVVVGPDAARRSVGAATILSMAAGGWLACWLEAWRLWAVVVDKNDAKIGSRYELNDYDLLMINFSAEDHRSDAVGRMVVEVSAQRRSLGRPTALFVPSRGPGFDAPLGKAFADAVAGARVVEVR